jgi:lysosomal Pro-X carboxypeptidase
MRTPLALRVLSWIVLLQTYCHSDESANTGQTPDPFVSFSENSRMSIADMTCKFFTQPLNHFVPRGRSPNYRQRYCYYSGFATPTITSTVHHRPDPPIDASSSSSSAPIFFYTGNESPLEQYINHTGLMWELAPIFHAHVVFVEHRYEGQSLPPANLSRDCLSYASTIQALADYATILKDELIPQLSGTRSSSSRSRTPLLPPPPPPPAVIAFGGSYGGMLSAWFRFKYPHIVTGAIAASAPIGAFPQAANHKIDASAQVIARGMDLPYPPDQDNTSSASHLTAKNKEGTNHCRSNLLAAWPLLTYLVRQTEYQTMVQDALRLCTRPESTPAFVSQLLAWGQSIWFDLAEGSFPYPSTYIPFALLHENIPLPAWPLQAACWNTSQLHQDWGVRFSPRVSRAEGHGDDDENDEALNMSPSLSCVEYDITYGASGLTLHIDWNNVTVATTATKATIQDNMDLIGLLTSVRDAVSIWYNITQDVPCYNVSVAAPNLGNEIHGSWNWNEHGIPKKRGIRRFRKPHIPLVEMLHPSNKDMVSHVETVVVTTNTDRGDRVLKGHDTAEPTDDPAQVCRAEIRQGGSWGPLCCNDEINLVITNARGLGQDFFWPPSHPRGTKTYADTVRNVTGGSCPDPDGIFGYSTEPYDPWSSWMDATYGSDFLDSSCLEGHSNIVFSNGLLDPWSAGGVYAAGMDPTTSRPPKKNNEKGEGASLQNITDRDLIALVIPLGGHHTDLMYSNPEHDPKCVKEARRIESDYIAKWIEQWNRDQEGRRVDFER